MKITNLRVHPIFVKLARTFQTSLGRLSAVSEVVVEVEVEVEVLAVEAVDDVEVTTGTSGWADTSSPAADTASQATEVAAAVAATQMPT